MKIFRTKKHDLLKIQEFELIKQTEKSVWFKKTHWHDGEIKEERSLKATEWYRFFDTHEEALQYLTNKAESKLEYLTNEIEKYTNILKELRS